MTTPDRTPPSGRGPGFAIAFVLFVLATLALVVLVWQNQDPVPLRWLWIDTEVPLFLIVLVTALVAVLLDELVGFIWRARRRRRLAEKEELKRLRAESSRPADGSLGDATGSDETG